MILHAKSQHITQMKQLWQICFGDSLEYIDFFFENQKKQISLISVEEDQVVSMLFLLPAALIVDGSTPIYYLYAACTHPQWRKKGQMEALIAKAKSVTVENGYHGIVLLPGNAQLYQFYEKFGFVPCFSHCVFQGEAGNIFDLSLSSHSEKSCSELRAYAFADTPRLCWKDEMLSYCLREHEFNGGNRVFIQLQNATIGYALYTVSADIVTFQELCVPAEYVLQAVNAVCMMHGKGKFNCNLPVSYGLGKKEKFGMLWRPKGTPDSNDLFLSLALN